MNTPNNRQRAFADVVTIDAWHKPFSGKVDAADLHADVVFGTARVGAEAESSVRFRLSVKRAEIIVVIPDHEPVGVDKTSVSRDSPSVEGRIVQTVEHKQSRSARAMANARVDTSGAALGGEAGANIAGSVESVRRTETVAAVQVMLTLQTRTAEGHYRWEVEGVDGKALAGRPWNAQSARLRLVDQRTDTSRGLPPSVRVEVRCRREDLIIEDLVLKDSSGWEEIKSKMGFKNRMAAAISYIRSQLLREGLEVENFQDPYGELTIGSVLAEHA